MDGLVTVERVGHVLVVGDPDEDREAVALAEALAPERFRTTVVVGASAHSALAELDPWVVADLADAARGGLRVLAPDLARGGPDGTLPPGQVLSELLGVEIVVPDGTPVALADGSLFVAGEGTAWVSYRAGAPGARTGPRLPAPWWQDLLPGALPGGVIEIPLGLWLREPGAPARPGDPLWRRPADPDRMYVVVGAPGEAPPAPAVIAGLLGELPGEARDRAVLVWHGGPAQAGAVAGEIGTPVRMAHGVPGDSGPVYADRVGDHWRPFAVESVCLPGGARVVERWVAPGPSMALAEPGSYRLLAGWRVDVVACGLLVRPEPVRPDPEWAGETGPTCDIIFATRDLDSAVPADVVAALDDLISALPGDARDRLRVIPVTAAALAAAGRLAAADRVVLPHDAEAGRDAEIDQDAEVDWDAEFDEEVDGIPDFWDSLGAWDTVAGGDGGELAGLGGLGAAEPSHGSPGPVAVAPLAEPGHAVAPGGAVVVTAAGQVLPAEPVLAVAAGAVPPQIGRPVTALPAVTAAATMPDTAPHTLPPAVALPAPRPEPVAGLLSTTMAPPVTEAPRAPEVPEAAEIAAASGGAGPVEVPADARSTPQQWQSMRGKLGARYDVAARAVTRLLSERPGLRTGSGDHAALLAELAVVRVFAEEPDGPYDADFSVCLASGVRRLPTARTVVVRGIPADTAVRPGAVLRLPTPVLAGPGLPARTVGAAEALIWSASARSLSGLLDRDPDDPADLVLPGHIRLRVLAVDAGPVRRVLIAEEGTPGGTALARLRAVAAARDEARDSTAEHPATVSRWFGPLPAA